MDFLPRLHYKKSRIPLPVDELFQQSICVAALYRPTFLPQCEL